MNIHLKSSRENGMVSCNHSLEIRCENMNIIAVEEATIIYKWPSAPGGSTSRFNQPHIQFHMPFYIRDLSVCGFWYPAGSRNQSPVDSER